MKKKGKHHIIYVFGLSVNTRHTITVTKKIISLLINKYKISFNCTIEEGAKINPQFHKFLNNFFADLKIRYNYIDVNWLYYFDWVINEPKNYVIDHARNFLMDDYEFLEPYFQYLMKNYSQFLSICGPQFFSIDDIPLKEGQGPNGVNIGDYPLSISVDVSGFDGSIIHEFLHLFGVTEGYSSITKQTTCNTNCWMQYDANKGNQLCMRHQKEVVNFFE